MQGCKTIQASHQMLLVDALCTFVLGRVCFIFRRAPLELYAIANNADRDINVVHLLRSGYHGGNYMLFEPSLVIALYGAVKRFR